MKHTLRRFFVALALAGLLVTSVAAGPPGPPDDVGPPPGTPGLDRATEVANQHAKDLLDILGIEGVGVGLTDAGKPTIIVFTESAGVEVPQALGGFPITVVVTGKIQALAPPPAQASFTFTCSGLSCTFDGTSSSGAKLSHTWDFGDATGGSGAVVSHTYAAGGTYSVTLNVQDKFGNVDSTSQSVTVSANGGSGGLQDCHTSNQTTVKCQRPVPLGVSIGHPLITAGTLGARVTAGSNVYILSNNHVLANENAAATGDPILQPGAFDGGVSPADSIGNLSAYVVLKFNNTATCTEGVSDPDCNLVDAAIASTTTANVQNNTVSAGYGVPKSTTVAAAVGQKIQKCGRTTGCTSGRVYAINVTVDVGYDGGVARFAGQIVVVGGGFSAGGDSGSLVVTQGGPGGGRNPMGLLFAGSINSTIINPIAPVLSLLGIAIDGE